MTAVVSAQQYKGQKQGVQAISYAENIKVMNDEIVPVNIADVSSEDSPEPSTVRQRYRYRYQNINVNCELKAEFEGEWGYAGDNETAGYIEGVVGRRGRFGFLNGEWNTIDNENSGDVLLILKKGFFNGRVTTEDGGAIPITGFYKFNLEEKTFNLRWMTPNKVGWCHGSIILDNTESDEELLSGL